jgi:hypothetical protein
MGKLSVTYPTGGPTGHEGVGMPVTDQGNIAENPTVAVTGIRVASTKAIHE